MNTIGFCDSLNDLLKTQGVKIIDNGVNDVRIVGAVALVVMCVICAVGMDWESKAQVTCDSYYAHLIDTSWYLLASSTRNA